MVYLGKIWCAPYFLLSFAPPIALPKIYPLNNGNGQKGWGDDAVRVSLTNYKGVQGDPWLGQEHGTVFNNGDMPTPDSPFPSGFSYKDEQPIFKFKHKNGTDRDCHRDHRCRGFFYRNTWYMPVELRTVTDGTSNTFMIGEDVAELNNHSMAFYSNTSASSCNIPLNNGLEVLGQGEVAIDSFANEWWNAVGFKSKHPQGVHFVKADGSVTFVSEQADDTAFRTSCTRNGEEVVSTQL